MQFYSVYDYNDAYFEIMENHKFQYYRSLFDRVPNSRFWGEYSTKADTLILHFTQEEGYKILGTKAVIDSTKHRITFYK